MEPIKKAMIIFLEKNQDKEYKVNIDYNKSINEQMLMKETRALLAIIYRDYLCSSEKRKELIYKDKEEFNRMEEEKREKYNPNNIFKKHEIENEKSEDKGIIIYKESIFQKIINKIKSIFVK